MDVTDTYLLLVWCIETLQLIKWKLIFLHYIYIFQDIDEKKKLQLKSQTENATLNKNNSDDIDKFIGIHHQHLWVQPHIIEYNEMIKFINHF